MVPEGVVVVMAVTVMASAKEVWWYRWHGGG